MVSIESDDARIGRSLERLLAAARRAGAEFADDLILRCAEGSLSIALPPHSAAERLIKLPEAALIPVRPFRLFLKADDIVIDAVDAGVSAERRTLMESTLELYNLTGKIAWYRRTAVPLFLHAHRQLAGLVARGCDPAMQRMLMDPVPADAADSFLLTRFLDTRVVKFREEPTDPAVYVLAPIVDLMNHHAKGATFQNRAEDPDRSLCVERARSLPLDASECFACYGSYDAMETLLRYNFADESATFLRSIPVVVTLPGVGTITADTGRDRSAGKGLPPALKPIGRYLPKILNRQPRYLKVAFLAVPDGSAPQALRRVLNLLIATLDREFVDRLDLIRAAETQVIDANRVHYRDLRRAVTATAAGQESAPILADLLRACDLQLARLQAYDDMARDLAA